MKIYKCPSKTVSLTNVQRTVINFRVPITKRNIRIRIKTGNNPLEVSWVCLYLFLCYVHLRFKHAVLGTHRSQESELVIVVSCQMLVIEIYWPLKTHCVLEPEPRSDLSTYQIINH